MNQSSNKIAFQDTLQRILKHSGLIAYKVEIKSSEYQQFWEMLQQPENSTIFMIELIKLLYQTEHSKKGKNYTSENLLCTLITLCMFRKVDIDKRKRELTDAKNQWEHYIAMKKPTSNPYSITIIYYLMQWLSENDENSFAGYVIGSIAFLHDIYKIAKPENIEGQYENLKAHYAVVDSYSKVVRVKNNDAFYNYLLDERFDLTETGEYMFCYEYILRLIKEKNHRNVPRIIYDAIIKYLKMIPFIAQDFPEQAEKSVLSLLHMTKQFITFFSCDIPEVLKTLLHQVEIFRRWPFPVGIMAAELVQVLYQECKCRCSSFRMKLREDVPDIDFLAQIRTQTSASQQQGITNSFTGHGQHQPHQNINLDEVPSRSVNQLVAERILLQVFTFVDERSPEAMGLLYYTQHYVRAGMQPVYDKLYNSNSLRIYLIAQILSLDGKNKMTPDKLQILAGFSEAEVFQLYCKLLVILEKCDQLDSLLDINMIQENAFEEIVKDITNRPKSEQDGQTDFSSVIGDSQLKIPEYPMFNLLNISNRQIAPMAGKQSILQPGQQSSTNISYQMVKQFIRTAYDNHAPLHTEPLRILVYGGDIELQRVCQLLGELYSENPLSLRTLDIRIYIVPSSECALAEFIAVKDAWYQRYLYLPIMEDLIIPKLDNIKDEGSKKDQSQMMYQDRQVYSGQLPLELKSQVLHTYMREANRAYNVRVYKLKVWQQQSPQSANGFRLETGFNPTVTPDGYMVSTLFFCSYVMFGADADFEVAKDRSRDDKMQKMTLYDYKEKNLCKYQWMNTRMKTESTDMLGNITVDDEVQVQLHTCKINNVYTDFFEGNMPMPHTDWLELSYLSYENAKVFDGSIKQKNLFKKHSRENIQNAFNSLFTNISITKIFVEEQTNKPFPLIVDGRIVDNVIKLKISTTKLKKAMAEKLLNPKNPSNNQSIKNLNLPVMSFLPFRV